MSPSNKSAVRFIDWLAEKLSRVTSTGELIPEIDGLRFIAIGVVVFHHMLSMYLPAGGKTGQIHSSAEWFAAAEFSPLVLLAYCGHFGVHLFFAISGFILALPFAKRALSNLPPPNLKSYYLRRVTRIEPPYAVSMIAGFIYLVHAGRDAEQLFPHLLASLFYLHGMVFGSHSLINSVTWSLEIEIQFYLMVPLLVKVFMLRNAILRRAAIFALILGSSMISQWIIYPLGSPRLELSLFNYLHYFLVGFALADFYLTGWLRGPARNYSWDFVTLVSGAAIAGVLLKYGYYYYLLPVFVGTMYAGFFLGRISNWFVRLRWVVIIGGMCYTIYLYHIALIAEFFPRTIGFSALSNPFILDFLLQAILLTPPLLAACAVLFVITEKPFMRWSLSSKPAAQPSSAD